MTGIKKLAAACAAALACAWAGEAGATIYTFTYQGTITTGTIAGVNYNGTDGDGMFGPAGASLVGDNFTAVFKDDTTIGYYQAGWGGLLSEGGQLLNFANPIVSAELTINGRTQAFTSNLIDSASIGFSYVGGVIQQYSYVSFVGGSNLNVGELLYVDALPPIDGNSFGAFHSADLGTIGIFTVDSASVSPIWPALPEPGTWAMLVLGVAMIGFAARRRREDMHMAA